MAKFHDVVRAPKKTGIVLKPKYYRFIKNTLQSQIRDNLNVEITASEVRPNGTQEVLLIAKGSKPFHYGEAKALIRRTIKMTAKNWEDVTGNSPTGERTEVTQIVDLEASLHSQEILSGGDTLADSKENIKGSPGSQVVCDGKSTPGLCTVVMDTRGGSVPINNEFFNTVYQMKDKNNKSNMINMNDSNTSAAITLSDICGREQKTTNSSNQAGEDFIEIHSGRSRKTDPRNETIVLQDDTILISSDDESEEDIKIEKIVGEKSGSSKQAQKEKPGTAPIENGPRVPVPSNCPNLKRNKNSPSLWQRKSKISKKSQLSDVTSDTGVTPLENNLLHPKSGKGKCPEINHSVSVCNESGSSTNVKQTFHNNLISPEDQSAEKTGLRPIIIDANNVSREGKLFQFRKLEICLKYFRDRNHRVIAFLPRHMQAFVQSEERVRMWKLEEERVLCFTPSRKMPDGKHYAAYDDRFIVQTATELGGIIVSNDNFRDIVAENEQWKDTVQARLLMYTWVGDMLMFPIDPLGRDGPHLEEFLRFPSEE